MVVKGTTTIRIRRDLTKSREPLFVDGKTMSNPMIGIKPEDTESIEVIKDASATSLYVCCKREGWGYNYYYKIKKLLIENITNNF